MAALTVAIPFYRGLEYLRESIDSVLAQTVDDWELVVVDDRGPHSAEELVASYRDPRIRYRLNAENLGLAGNWNECVRVARTPLVTLLHNDDRLRPAYAARVIAAAQDHPEVDAVFTDAVVIGPTGAPVQTVADRVKALLPRPGHDHVLQGDRALAGLTRGNYIVCPTLCLRRGRVGDAPFDPTLRFVPDWAFTTGVLLRGGSLYAVREALLDYRRHPGTETARLTADSSRFDEELAFLRGLDERAAAAGFARTGRTARRRATVRGHLAVRAGQDLVHGRWSAAREKAALLRADLTSGLHHPDPQQG